MSNQLPHGWVKTTLGEICLPVATIQPKDLPDTDFTYFDIGGIDNKTNRIVETKIIKGRNAPSRARQAVRKDDILFSTVRTYLRKIAYVEHDYLNSVASTGFAVIRAAEGVSSQFLFFQILSEGFLRPIHALQTGSSYPAVHQSDVFAQPILLPPFAEQERIAAKLNTVLSGIQRAQVAAQRALKRLDSYRDSVLNTAVSGDLTQDWRESQRTTPKRGEILLKDLLASRRTNWEKIELQRLSSTGKTIKDDKWKLRYPEPTLPLIQSLSNLPDGWIWASLDELSIVVRGASPRPAGDPRYFGGAVPWITVGSLTQDSEPYLTETVETVTEAGKEASRYIEAETLLLTNSGATLGVPKISRIAGCINDGVAALLGVEYPLKLYLYYFLATQTKKLRDINQGAAQPNLNTGIIRNIVVALPPVAEQIEIINEVSHRLSSANRLATILEQQISRAYATRQSLLQEAFDGRLIQQNHEDEDASSLMEHIRFIRQVQSQKPKGRHMSKSKSEVKVLGRGNLLAILKENNGPMTPEELFRASGYSQESVDQFFADLRELTDAPTKIEEERKSGRPTLKVVQ